MKQAVAAMANAMLAIQAKSPVAASFGSSAVVRPDLFVDASPASFSGVAGSLLLSPGESTSVFPLVCPPWAFLSTVKDASVAVPSFQTAVTVWPPAASVSR